jgi:hypothetical protein
MSNLDDQLEDFIIKEGNKSPAQVIADAFKGLMQETHICIPGIITSFDPVTRTGSIQPALMQKYLFKDSAETIPPIPSVPVIFPGVGSASFFFPENLLKSGTMECLLLVCERSIDTWYKQGGVVDPADERMNDFTDSVALVGFSSEPKLNARKGATTSFEMDYGNSWVEITQSGKFKITNGSNELFSLIDQLIGTLQSATSPPPTYTLDPATQAALITIKAGIDALKG